jgi:predicted dinucleotide-binding enzyme
MIKIGVLGTGVVGNTIATKLISLGHDVMMGSRTADNSKLKQWMETMQGKGKGGTFKDAASHGEIIFNCTAGGISTDVLKSAGEENISGKIIVDISNPLDFSRGMPPVLIDNLCNTNSVGEEIQKLFPSAKVVKTLNTMNCYLMVNPPLVPGEHDVFISGNDSTAKHKVIEILNSFGWKSPIDLGDITSARAVEQVLPLWVRLYGSFKTSEFNFKIVRK